MSRLSILKYLFNILKLIDVAANVLVCGAIKIFVPLPPGCGNPHYTCSEALDELRNAGSKTACVCCKILTFVFKWFNRGVAGYDHCKDSMRTMPYDITSS